MNDTTPIASSDERISGLLLDSRTRELTASERQELNQLLRNDPQACVAAARLLVDDAILAEELRAGQLTALLSSSEGGMMGPASSHVLSAALPARQPWWRPWIGVAAGLVLGLSAAGGVLAFDLPRSVWTWWSVEALADGDFSGLSGSLPIGYPHQSGRWSGDPARFELPDGTSSVSGGVALRFVAPGADASDPRGRAYSCDVLQVVDLRAVQSRLTANDHAMLVLSARVRDDRPADTPRLRFSLRLYCYGEDATTFATLWPRNIEAALAGGQVIHHSTGGDAAWKEMSTRVALPPEARSAVVQVVASPETGGPAWSDPPIFAQQWVDDVRLDAQVLNSSGGRETRP